MKKRVIESVIGICHMEELDNTEIRLVKKAIEATERSYARYSNFKVGAALLLEDGTEVIGCNRERSLSCYNMCRALSTLFRWCTISRTCRDNNSHSGTKRKWRIACRTNHTMWKLPASAD